MCLSYTQFIASIFRDWYKPCKRLPIKTKICFDLFNRIKTYTELSTCNQPICNANKSNGFYIIQGSFAKGTLEKTLVKVQDEATKFLVLGFLEYYPKYLKNVYGEVHF